MCRCEVFSVWWEATRWCLCDMVSSGDTAVVPFTDQHSYLCSISRLSAHINIPSPWASDVFAIVFTVRSQANTWTLRQREQGWTMDWGNKCLNWLQWTIKCYNDDVGFRILSRQKYSSRGKCWNVPFLAISGIKQIFILWWILYTYCSLWSAHHTPSSSTMIEQRLGYAQKKKKKKF